VHLLPGFDIENPWLSGLLSEPDYIDLLNERYVVLLYRPGGPLWCGRGARRTPNAMRSNWSWPQPCRPWAWGMGPRPACTLIGRHYGTAMALLALDRLR